MIDRSVNRGETRRVLAAVALTAAVLCAGALASSSSAGMSGPASETVWLCFPGESPNPCRDSLETTHTSPSGQTFVRNPSFPQRPAIDCFYVYPTVSNQSGTNANKDKDPELNSIANYQAARFSQTCRVFAPVYRQRTLLTIFSPPDPQVGAAATLLAYRDVRDAFRDYIANYNRGRGFVLIGHSQGTTMLVPLLRQEIEPRPSLRERLVSAILLGGAVTVRKGKKVGGAFRHVPGCTRPAQVGCVIAYSTFNETPPDDTRFGKPRRPPVNVFRLPYGPNVEILCSNPGSLRGGTSRPLKILLRTEPFAPGLIFAGLMQMYGGPPPSASTPWLQPQDRYSARCVTENGANVLKISPVGEVQHLNPSPNDTWGLHLADVNIALGNLVGIVKAQTRAYLRLNR